MNVTEMEARKATVWHQMQDLDRRATEANRPMTAEELGQWNALDAELESLSATIDQRKRSEELEARFAAKPEAATLSVGTAPAAGTVDSRYTEAFRAWARRGTADLSPEHRSILQSGYREDRAQGTGTTAGGYLIPPEF